MLLQLITNGVISGGIYALISIGFTIIYRTVKFFHLAYGMVYAVGAYFAYSIIQSLDERFANALTLYITSFLLAITISAILGVVIDRLVYYKLRNQNASNLVFLLASFGVFVFLQNLIQLIYGAQILTLRIAPVKEGNRFLGVVITDVQLAILLVSFVCLVLLWVIVQKTKLGKAIRAVSDDPVAASIIGINPEKIISFSFAIGSALASLAGILISFETNIEPNMGFNAILKGIIASIVGGIGSIPGAILGGYFLGLAENLSVWKIQAGWKDAIAFIILIIFLLIRPRGILGTKSIEEGL